MGTIARAFKALAEPFTPKTVPHQPQSWTLRLGLPEERDYRRYVEQDTSSIIGAAIAWMVRNFPEAPLTIGKQSGDKWEDMPEHPLLDSIDSPNAYYDGTVLWMGTIAAWVLDGNAYWLKVRNNGGGIAELWYTPPGLIIPKGDERTFIEYYEYTVAGRRYSLAPTEIVHFRFGIDPDNPRKGRSPLREQLREVYTDEEAARFTAALLHNLGTPGLIVAPKGEGHIGAEQRAAIKQALLDKTTGDRRGEPLILEGGEIEVHKLSFSPQELSLRELRGIPEERTTAALGLPAAVLGLGSGLATTKVGATLREFREQAVEQCLVPTWRILAQQLKRSLLPDFEKDTKGWEISFDLSNVRVLQEDMDALAKRHQILVAAGIEKRSEAREVFGLAVEPTDEVYHIPLSVMEVGPGQSRETVPPTREAKSLGATLQQRRYAAIVDRATLRLADKMAQQLEGLFNRLGEVSAAEYLRRHGNGIKALEDEMLAREIAEGPALQEVEAQFGEAYARTYRLTAETAMAVLDETLGIGLEIGARDVVSERIVALGGTRKGLLDVTSDTRDAIFQTLTKAREEGLGVPQAARRIREMVPAGPFPNAGPKYRAQLIARTETRYAFQQSVYMTGRAAGFERFVILDARLGPTDEECMRLDGVTVDWQEAESLMASEHPNGTRQVVPEPRTVGLI